MNVRNEVWKIIERDPSIKLDLSRGLINIRALSRYLRDEGVNGSEDAIISAIRRFPIKKDYFDWFKGAIQVIKNSSISTRSHVAEIVMRRTTKVQEILPALLSKMTMDRSERVRLLEGEQSITVILDDRNFDEFLEIIPKKSILRKTRKVGEINIALDKKTFDTPGVLSIISNELSRNNVNFVQIMSSVPELIIFVDGKDLPKAYKTLINMME